MTSLLYLIGSSGSQFGIGAVTKYSLPMVKTGRLEIGYGEVSGPDQASASMLNVDAWGNGITAVEPTLALDRSHIIDPLRFASAGVCKFTRANAVEGGTSAVPCDGFRKVTSHNPELGSKQNKKLLISALTGAPH